MTPNHESRVEAGDPLIDEIRAIREQIWREDDEDMEKHFERLLKLQEKYKERVVSPDKTASAVNET